MSRYDNFARIDEKPIRFFDTAEDAWLWFCFCEAMPRAGGSHNAEAVRPCETSDIAIIVKRLAIMKILTQEHLKILTLYGLKQMPPIEKCGDPKKDCDLWKQALNLLLNAFRLKGIVDKNATALPM